MRLRALMDFFFPRQCVVCGRNLAIEEHFLCSCCLLGMPVVRYASYEDNPMAQTFWGLVPFERAAAIFHYRHDSALSRLLFEMKYHHNPRICYEMGRLMATKMLARGFFDGVDVIVPIPLAEERRRERGYNQSECLARGIADVTGLPVSVDSVVRMISNPSQTMLGADSRRENVRDIFAVTDPDILTGCHVLLVDDVMTTGATLLSCAETIAGRCTIRLSVLTLAVAGHSWG